MRIHLLLITSLLSLPSAAQINKCAIDGRIVYQAAPCPRGAAASTLNYRNDIADEAAKDAREEFLAKEKSRRSAERRQDIEREIAFLERQIERHQRDMDAEIAALRNAKRYASNNLAGATWEQSLSSEMQAVATRYQTKIKAAQDKIASLRDELKSIK